MKYTIFDIETSPAAESYLCSIEPEFEAPGNVKDPEKIKAALQAKRAEWYDRAALDAITGTVLAVGFVHHDGREQIIHSTDEPSVLQSAIQVITDCACAGIHVVGFNSHKFDLPFIVKRARANSLRVPNSWLDRWKGRISWSSNFIDLMTEWTCGTGEYKGQSLDNIAACLGLQRKNGDGKLFAELYRTNQAAALDYLHNDLVITKQLAERLLPKFDEEPPVYVLE